MIGPKLCLTSIAKVSEKKKGKILVGTSFAK
jgi:hypothetical protein